MSVPPNNLEQLIPWIRVFAENTQSQLTSLKKTLLDLKSRLDEKEKKK